MCFLEKKWWVYLFSKKRFLFLHNNLLIVRMAAQQQGLVAKLLLLGDSGVGKSSIMMRFADDKFDDNMLSTAGVDFKGKTWTVDGQQLKLTIWYARRECELLHSPIGDTLK